MIVDVAAVDDLATVQDLAHAAEKDGYNGLWLGETKHDVFLQVLLAAQATSRIQVGTSIAVAFARSPMTVAYQANDLQLISRGRFVLGLGTQVRAHVERRFSMLWGLPASQMREYIAAVRQIWRSWSTGERLDFTGDYYRLSLMNDFFSPGVNPFGNTPIYLAAVGDRLTRTAGEVADGLIAHAFSTAAYLRDHIAPVVAQGLARSDRPRRDFVLSATVTVACGNDDLEIAEAGREGRKRIAFYGSTPTYRGVLSHHGWGELADALANKARDVEDAGRWETMADMIDDEVLDEFVVRGSVDEVVKKTVTRYEDAADRITLYSPSSTSQRYLARIAHAVAQIAPHED